MGNTQNFEPNVVHEDEFGRKSGLLLVNKPKGKTSHDMVYIARRKYDMRKVGHAGALDPFANGLIVVMLGKATKLSDSFLHLDKVYEADILLGIETDSGDTEGKVLEQATPGQVTKECVDKALDKFIPSYNQYVPVYSSVKVDGKKLRVVARKHASFSISKKNGERVAEFFDEEGTLQKEITLPKKEVKIYEANVLESTTHSSKDLEDKYKIEGPVVDYLESSNEYQVVKVKVACSKGTYIRQLAIDLGEAMGIPAMLIGLKRTQIGDYKLEDAIDLED